MKRKRQNAEIKVMTKGGKLSFGRLIISYLKAVIFFKKKDG